MDDAIQLNGTLYVKRNHWAASESSQKMALHLRAIKLKLWNRSEKGLDFLYLW